MPISPAGRSLVLCLASLSIATARNFLDPDFSQNVQATDAAYPNNSTVRFDMVSTTGFGTHVAVQEPSTVPLATPSLSLIRMRHRRDL